MARRLLIEKEVDLLEGENWKKVVKSSDYNPASYRKFMSIVKKRIEIIESEMSMLERYKKMSKFSYGEWLKAHNGIKDDAAL